MEFLGAEDRELLVLRKWDNLSFTEIGKRLGVSPDAARMRHNRAVQRLGDNIWALSTGNLESIVTESPA
jgi:DNA-directed RNA polymerase specialized sigma24 family protein